MLLLFLRICAASCLGAAVTFNGPQIMIDGRSFLMKGVCYSPTPIGLVADQPPYGEYYTTTYRSL